jgi:hypothetical protein
MPPTALATVGFVIVWIAALFVLLSRDWRWMLAALVGVYVGMFLMVLNYWPIMMSVAKLLVGWMAVAVIGVTQFGQKEKFDEHSWPTGRFFRLLAAGMVMLVIFSIAPRIVNWLPVAVDSATVEGSITLVGLGLLQLGMTAHPMRVIVGLLIVLAGFEILFAAIESSILVAGLLAGVNLGLSLMGSYLLSSPSTEVRE